MISIKASAIVINLGSFMLNSIVDGDFKCVSVPCDQLGILAIEDDPAPDPSAAIPVLTLSPGEEIETGVWSTVYQEYGTTTETTLAPCDSASDEGCGARASDDDPDFPDISMDIKVCLHWFAAVWDGCLSRFDVFEEAF